MTHRQGSLPASRREFITLLGGAAAGWPLTAGAQQRSAMPVIGFLTGGPTGIISQVFSEGFHKGLNEMGFVDGRNVAVEIHAADGQYNRLPKLAADLVRRQPDVIFAWSPANTARAAKAATTTIPIVFATGLGDPVQLGLVASMNRPGGNVTGVSFYTSALGPKRLELLRDLVPQADTIGFLTNPTSLGSDTGTADIRVAARSVDQKIVVFNASTADEIETAFATAAQQRVSALLVDADQFFNQQGRQLTTLALRFRIPASYANRTFVETGGLMSYGDDRAEMVRLAAIYIGRILKGAKPADLPILQPTRFQFVLNLKTAKALGLDIPLKLHAFADEVIE